jgi:hypothetical protein
VGVVDVPGHEHFIKKYAGGRQRHGPGDAGSSRQ